MPLGVISRLWYHLFGRCFLLQIEHYFDFLAPDDIR